MKKETVILLVVIAFLVGFISGATVAILKGTKGAEKTAMVQKPKMAPPGAPPVAPQGAPPDRNSIKGICGICNSDVVSRIKDA